MLIFYIYIYIYQPFFRSWYSPSISTADSLGDFWNHNHIIHAASSPTVSPFTLLDVNLGETVTTGSLSLDSKWCARSKAKQGKSESGQLELIQLDEKQLIITHQTNTTHCALIFEIP